MNKSYIAIIRIGSRPVNVIYGHMKDGEECSEDHLEEFDKVIQKSSEAYINLISHAKSKS